MVILLDNVHNNLNTSVHSILQALAMGAVMVGLHKGEPYYLKDQLVEVHAAGGWKKRGREIRETELDIPYKVLKAKKGLQNSSKGDENHVSGRLTPDSCVTKADQHTCL